MCVHSKCVPFKLRTDSSSCNSNRTNGVKGCQNCTDWKARSEVTKAETHPVTEERVSKCYTKNSDRVRAKNKKLIKLQIKNRDNACAMSTAWFFVLPRVTQRDGTSSHFTNCIFSLFTLQHYNSRGIHRQDRFKNQGCVIFLRQR